MNASTSLRSRTPAGRARSATHASDTGIATVALPELEAIRPERAAARMPRHAQVLLIAGARDDRAPPSDAYALAAHIPAAEVLVMPGRDHEDLGDVPNAATWERLLSGLPRPGSPP